MALVRAANNGISAMIDPYGRLLGTIPLNIRGTLDAPLPAPAPQTAYSAMGDSLWAAMSVVCLLLSFRARRAHAEKR